ncbi:hypothetical protein KDRO_F10440 [Kluyveromyces lactis]|nr:hypothetical protein KDRO_F10440 [Kluyveromyces lactis]
MSLNNGGSNKENFKFSESESVDLDSEKQVADGLSRDIKPRTMMLLTLGSAIGTGFIIGSGTALKRGGPISIFLGYLFTGSILSVVIFSLAEMASFLPMEKGFSGYLNKYVDPAVGFAAGWNYFFKYAIVLSANLTAFGLVIQYWREDINVAVWVTVLYVSVFVCNFVAVRYFALVEYWLTVAKLLVVIIIFITCLVITCGGGPNGKTIGFQYWKDPGFVPYLVKGDTGKFLGWWACVVQSIFGFMGSEMIGIIFGEAHNPKKTIPKASFNVFLRIFFLYVVGVFILGLSVSPTDPQLVKAGGTNASASPFVIAISSSGIKVFPSFINACLLVFIGSSANTDIYICSRQLYGLAKDGAAPKLFLKLNRYKVPYWGCVIGSLLGFLAYMNVNASVSTVFGYITSTVSVFGIINWFYILVAYVNYQRAIKAQNVPREEIPFRMIGQPYLAYISLFFVVVITIFNGYNSFIPNFQYKTFITTYIGILVNAVLLLGYKIYHRTSIRNPLEIDLERT